MNGLLKTTPLVRVRVRIRVRVRVMNGLLKTTPLRQYESERLPPSISITDGSVRCREGITVSGDVIRGARLVSE